MIRAPEKLLAEGIGPSVERQAECQQSGLARRNTFEAVAKEQAPEERTFLARPDMPAK